ATVRGKQQVVNTEVHRNLSMSKTGPRYAVDVVKEASKLIRLTDIGLGNRPAATGSDVTGNPHDSDFQALGGSANDGDEPGTNEWLSSGPEALRVGMLKLDRIDPFIFNILCIPAASNLSEDGINLLIPQ